jgi:hypothetical protein
MARKPAPRANQQRVRIAQEAARIIREQGVRDYLVAKRKAAQRLAIFDRNVLPSNTEVAEALGEQQRLFGGEAHVESLTGLRLAAREAMLLLNRFEPRLVGPVLEGTATAHSGVLLHVFADAPEAVALALMERGVPYESAERRVRMRDGRYVYMPVFRFTAGETEVDATVFSLLGLREPPASPVDGRPMRRARLAEVEALLAEAV